MTDFCSPFTGTLSSDCAILIGPRFKRLAALHINSILVALFVTLILVNVLQIFGTVSQLIPIFRRSLDLSIV